jgi:transketolase
MASFSTISANSVRKTILEQAKRAHVGHIGSALSVVDILTALYRNIICIDGPDSPERDRFILSNGHTSLALYAVLHARGLLTDEEINTFCTDNSYLGVHPEFAVKGIDFSSGSLGQGLSIGCGCALAAKKQHSRRRAFVLMSDAECNEGSVWEAVMFAAHNQLSNLVAIIDLNGQQALGYTRDVMNLSPMAAKWEAFQWDVHEVDGNDIEQLTRVMQSLNTDTGQPHVIIAHTVFGKGISFMESKIKWHYFPLSDEEYQQAVSELNDGL